MATRMIPKTALPENVRFDYDPHADVLHVSLGTGEPSFGEEVNDLLLMEFGIYSGTPTGFQLLHVKEVGIAKVEVQLKHTLKKVQNREEKRMSNLFQDRNRLFKEAVKALEEKGKELVSV